MPKKKNPPQYMAGEVGGLPGSLRLVGLVPEVGVPADFGYKASIILVSEIEELFHGPSALSPDTKTPPSRIFTHAPNNDPVSGQHGERPYDLLASVPMLHSELLFIGDGVRCLGLLSSLVCVLI